MHVPVHEPQCIFADDGGSTDRKDRIYRKSRLLLCRGIRKRWKTFVAALLACGWPNHKTYKWSDMRELMDYGLSNYHKADLSAEPLDDAWCAKIPVVNAKTDHLFEDAAAEVCLEDAEEVHSLLLKNDEKISVTCTVKRY